MNLGGLSFYEDASGNKYAVGADSVPKKLGDSDWKLTFTLYGYFEVNPGATASKSITVTVICKDGNLTVSNGSATYSQPGGNANVGRIQVSDFSLVIL